MKMDWTIERALGLSAAVSIIAAILLSAGSLKSIPEYRLRFEARRAELRDVEAAGKEAALHMSAIKAFEEAAAAPSPAIGTVVENAMPGAAAEIRDLGSGVLASGWRIRQVEIIMKNSALPAVGGLIEALESQRPPWRAVEFGVTAAGPGPATGHSRLVVERLEQPAR